MKFEEFKNIVERLLPETSERQFEQFRALEQLYTEWNSRINVISRKDIDSLYSHHVLHSLGIAIYLRQQRPETFRELAGKRLLDLGCGGGFPGIPLAILFPETEFVLCDSIGKKITVAKGVAEALGLTNVTTVNARAESLDSKFDWVVSRAVTSLDNFLPWIKSKYSSGILYLKGGDLDEEIAKALKSGNMRGNSLEIWNLSSTLVDEWFETKKLLIITPKVC